MESWLSDAFPVLAALGLGVFHTAVGPDHYLPFVALGQDRGWSLRKTAWITFVCGLGHVASSLLLGGLGLALGLAFHRFTALEGFRGDLAAWAMVAFGCVYGAYGVYRAIRHAEHHDHRRMSTLTLGSLFIVFLLGPCEALIPLFAVPASQGRWGIALVSGLVFTIGTLATMLGMVLGLSLGTRRLGVRSGMLHRWSHAIAGSVIMTCGLGILLGL